MHTATNRAAHFPGEDKDVQKLFKKSELQFHGIDLSSFKTKFWMFFENLLAGPYTRRE